MDFSSLLKSIFNYLSLFLGHIKEDRNEQGTAAQIHL